MAGGPLAIAALVIVLAIIAWVLFASGVFAKSVGTGEVDIGAEEVPSDALVYAVPPGQDTAVVLIALSDHGIQAQPDSEGPDPLVVVPRPDDVGDTTAWRERVRAAIATADTSMLDPAEASHPIRFADEQRT